MALKRAYADIILNTSKEAAARVMVSERKSQQLEHVLRVTKEEAIQMMLRLKKMMDDKVYLHFCFLYDLCCNFF